MRPAITVVPIASLLLACSGNPLRLNTSYHGRHEGTARVAVVPILTDDSAVSDDAFASAFDKAAKKCSLIPMAPMRQRLAGDAKLRGRLLAVAQRASAEDELARAPRIQEVVGPEGLADLHQFTDAADVMLFPVSLEWKELLGHTAGALVYRLYDLRDGSIVFQNAKTFNVNLAGDKGRLLLLYVLAGSAERDVEEHFLDVR